MNWEAGDCHNLSMGYNQSMPTLEEARKRVKQLPPDYLHTPMPEVKNLGKYAYTGTGLAYAMDKLASGVFSTERKEVHISSLVSEAYGYALIRTYEHRDTPAVIVFDPQHDGLDVRPIDPPDSRTNLVCNPISRDAIFGIYTLDGISLDEFVGVEKDQQHDFLMKHGVRVDL